MSTTQKIKLIKQNGVPVVQVEPKYQVQNSLENQYNSILSILEQKNITTITQNVYEWMIRTLAAEVYKLSFIDEKKFYRIKMLWPSFQEKDTNFFLQQFDGFDIEDYFDIIVFPSQDMKQLTFTILENQFTKPTQHPRHEKYASLQYFQEHQVTFEHVSDILNYFITECKKSQIQDINTVQQLNQVITEETLNERLTAIANGQTRLMLNELYNQNK